MLALFTKQSGNNRTDKCSKKGLKAILMTKPHFIQEYSGKISW